MVSQVDRGQQCYTYLDTNVVTNIDLADEFTTSNDDTSTLVTSNKRKLGWEGPVTVQCVEICVADTGVLDIDENLVGTRLGDGNLLVLERTASFLDDLSPLHLGNLGRRHCELVLNWNGKCMCIGACVLQRSADCLKDTRTRYPGKSDLLICFFA